MCILHGHVFGMFQASFSQDALSKCIYSKLFDWIVVQVNKVLHSQTKQNRFIGVLDIYGYVL